MPPPSKADLWSSGVDETVEVNQRALIDKILARYSGENTIFRELLQNADDAGAQHVQVKFYTEAGLQALEKGEGPSKLPNVKRDLIHRYVVTNDGIPFRPEDWKRLKKIAEGNPDEEKIGAFGVGFYSLWSVCDDPFVESGDKWMGFYWKDGKDQLLARSGDLPPGTSSSSSQPSMSGNPWTSFTMALREPSLLEGPLDLARFFITSLTFMRTMKRIDMLVDDVKVLELQKSIKGKERVSKRGLKQTSQGGMMTVTGVDATGMVINAKVMQWLAATGFTPPPLAAPIASLAKPAKAFSSFLSSSFFGRSSPSPAPTPPPPPPEPEDHFEITSLSRHIQIYQADIKVYVSSAFGRELERATKKPPPKAMPASLVFAREDDETVQNGGSGKGEKMKDAGGVFSGLCPPLDGEQSAKVFIGQATGQTTGVGGHLAARFIPTVERESIDLVDKHVSQWNKELLWIGGYLSRLVYELELEELKTLWQTTSDTDSETRAQLLRRGLHVLRFFTFRPTTPSAVVGQGIESAFYSCGGDNKAMLVVSNGGFLPVSQIRMPNPDIQKFLPDMPSISSAAIDNASRFVARLREQNLLREISLEDVIRELAAKPLAEKEMVECLHWWQGVSDIQGYNQQVRQRLLDAAILIQDNGKITPLGVIETYVKPQSSSIPTDMPLPQHTLPYSITKSLRGNSIYTIFGWTELSILQYITFLANPPMSNSPGADPETDMRVSPIFAERVLATLGRAWQSISANQQTAIALELKDVPCIPTKAGFTKPGEAYLDGNLLFDDLPTISLPKGTTVKGGMEKMLLAIGVRKTVNLQLVFSRLIGGGTWTCQDLMKYLVSVKDTLTSDELAKLRQTAAFPLKVETSAAGINGEVVRRKPNQLYEPTESMIALGLPVLDWGEGKWRSNSEEGKMLIALGLRQYPPVDTLLGIAAGPTPTDEKALAYLLNNINTHYANFDPSQFNGVAFIPATTPTGQVFKAKPGEVFSNPSCGILGFAVAQPFIARPENATKLRLPTDPPMSRLVDALLSKVTPDREKAQRIFEYLATQIGGAMAGSLDRLANAPFIPVKSDSDVKLVEPNKVYFVPREGANALFRSAFTYVDFGEKANLFLRMCGVRAEPSVRDIAYLLIREPGRMLKEAGSSEKYLEQLRLLAANWSSFDYTTQSLMRSASFVLASHLVPSKKAKKSLLGASTGDEDGLELEWVLAKASEVAVVDDIAMLQYFSEHVLAAPEEQLLEQFYERLGAKKLSMQVQTRYVADEPFGRPSPQAQAIRRHVLERLTIFLAETRRKSSTYTPEFLAAEGNFEVSEVSALKARYIYKSKNSEYSHTEKLYAVARKKDRGKGIILTLSTSVPQDDYDIAVALCNILLLSPKADDALLLNSILSTPLVALRKRGFNVDRILNQQREERLRIQAEAEKEREQLPAPTKAFREISKADFPELPPPPKGFDPAANGLDRAGFFPPGPPGAGSGMKGIFDRFKRPNRIADAAGQMGGPSTASSGGVKPDQMTKRPTDPESIRDTVKQAVNASRPELGNQITDNTQAIEKVPESQSDYCDLSARADLVLAIDPGPTHFKIWVPNNVNDHANFLNAEKLAITNRFATEILLPIGKIYKLAPNVMNIFWDHEGPLIAFNRGGAIFCNARYFTAWHNEATIHGNKTDAFISWYFSIAHELAHNLERAHNAQHEFFFSSIAEEYLPAFAQLLR